MKKILTAAILTLGLAMAVFAQQQAEITVTSTYLRQSPDFNSAKTRTLAKGEKVTLEKGREAGSWTYVSTADGVKGWVLTSTIQTLKNQTPPAIPKPSVQPKPQAPTQKPNVPAQKPNDTPQTVVEVPNPPDAQTTTPASDVVEEDNEAITVDTEEVSLNVRVINPGNRSVTNLKESSFRVYEDGVLQPITSLSTAEVPIFNALVIDNSRSLRTQLGKVIEAGKILSAANKTQDETSIVRFVGSDKIEVVQGFTANRAMVDNALDNLYVEGGQTAIIDAVYKAAQMVQEYQNSQKKEDVKIRALILVSDGDDRASIYTEKALFEMLRNSFVQIYAIGFPQNLSDVPDPETGISRRQKAISFLTRLAQETGGKVYFPDTTAQLAKIASEVSSELRTQYFITYAPTNDKRDGTFREIKVEVTDGTNGEKRSAITRTGRNAPSN